MPKNNQSIDKLVNLIRMYNDSVRSPNQSSAKYYIRKGLLTKIKQTKTDLVMTGHSVIIRADIKRSPGYTYLQIDGVEYAV